MPKDTARLIADLRQDLEQLKKENLNMQTQLKMEEDRSDLLIRQLRNAIDAYVRGK